MPGYQPDPQVRADFEGSLEERFAWMRYRQTQKTYQQLRLSRKRQRKTLRRIHVRRAA